MQVVLLDPSKSKQYRQLMLEAYELAPDAYTSTAEERAAEPDSFWAKRIADSTGKSAAFGAFRGINLIGTVAVEFSSKPKTRHKALVIGMYVTQSARRSGASQALMTAMLEYTKAREDIKVLTLTVTEGNEPAIRLYRSFGFETFGVEPMAILTPDGYKSKVHMWHHLQHGVAAA